MPYPRRLGQYADCTDPTTWATDPSCVGTDPMTGQLMNQPTDTTIPFGTTQPVVSSGSGGSSAIPGLVSTFLTDAVNFFKPGTPTTVPTYYGSPTYSSSLTSGAASFLNNPLALLAVGGAGYLLVKALRRH